MSIIRRSSPFAELLSLRQAMDRWFEDAFIRPPGMYHAASDTHGLPLDIYTTPDALVVEAALPGVKPDDVEITLTGDTLVITGTMQESGRADDQGFLYQEVRRGTFTRTVTLPAEYRPEEAAASFENGMLRLSIPRAAEAKPRQIRLTPTTEGSSDVAVSGSSDSGSGSLGSGDGTQPPTEEGSAQAQEPTQEPAQEPASASGDAPADASGSQAGVRPGGASAFSSQAQGAPGNTAGAPGGAAGRGGGVFTQSGGSGSGRGVFGDLSSRSAQGSGER